MIAPEVFEILGVIIAGAGSAFVGGKNSLNGFKSEVSTRFDNVDNRLDRLRGKIDGLIEEDGRHEARLQALEAPRVDKLQTTV